MYYTMVYEALSMPLFTQCPLSEAARCVPYRNRAQSVPVRNRMSSYKRTVLHRRTSSVCWESHGGGLFTGIFFPLYVTAGPTSLIFPARGC